MSLSYTEGQGCLHEESLARSGRFLRMEWQDRHWYIACAEVGARWVCTVRHNPEWVRRLVTLFWHINTSGDRGETEGSSSGTRGAVGPEGDSKEGPIDGWMGGDISGEGPVQEGWSQEVFLSGILKILLGSFFM